MMIKSFFIMKTKILLMLIVNLLLVSSDFINPAPGKSYIENFKSLYKSSEEILINNNCQKPKPHIWNLDSLPLTPNIKKEEDLQFHLYYTSVSGNAISVVSNWTEQKLHFIDIDTGCSITSFANKIRIAHSSHFYNNNNDMVFLIRDNVLVVIRNFEIISTHKLPDSNYYRDCHFYFIGDYFIIYNLIHKTQLMFKLDKDSNISNIKINEFKFRLDREGKLNGKSYIVEYHLFEEE